MTTWLAVLALLAAACAGAGGDSAGEQDGCAHVEAVSVTSGGDGAFTISVTVRSADTGDDKYADRWVVRTPLGEVLGERILLHPHVAEQPFTRSLDGVVIPIGVETIVVAAHDSVLGFCGSEGTAIVAR